MLQADSMTQIGPMSSEESKVGDKSTIIVDEATLVKKRSFTIIQRRKY